MTSPDPSRRVSESNISLADLRQRFGDPDLTIVDVRARPAFNGWRSKAAARGGHIPGAVAFPSAWLESVDAPEVQRLLRSKGILASRAVVLYGDRPEDTVPLKTRLAELGHARVQICAGGWPEWAADPTLPVDRLKNYDRLVDDEWLRDLLDGRRPEAAPTGRFLLFHVNFGVPEEYEENHIPGALYLDTNRLENPRDWNRRTPEELEAALRSFGITADTTVILYGRDTEGNANEKWPGRRAGQIAACRAALILRYAGVDDIRLLDGGYDHWVQAGNPVETILNRPEPVASFGVQIPLRPEIAANGRSAGIAPDKWVAFYCGTGWRAGETWFYAYLMGWPRIAVYDGGWFEWSQDPVSNPIEVGEPVAV